MNRYFKQSYSMMIVCLCFMTAFLYYSCASSELVRLRKRCPSMSDADLLNYYYGINERLKDIDNDMEKKEPSSLTEHEHFLNNETFFTGGEGYGLIQKRKVILEELNKRNIYP